MSLHLFKSLIDLTGDAVFIFSVQEEGGEFVIEYVNEAYIQKFGINAGHVLGKRLKDFLPAASFPLVYDRLRTCAGKKTSLCFEEIIHLPGGATTSLSELFPILDNVGNVSHVAGISKDISELKKQRDLLTESENTLQCIINSSENILVFVRDDFRIVYANAVAQRHAMHLWGRPLLTGENILDYLSENERETAVGHVDQLLKDRKPINFEHQVSFADGQQIWLLRQYYGAYDSKGAYIGLVVASINITERKNQELQIQKHAHTLREIAQIQSHEIRRPVANIIGLAGLIDLKGKTEAENEEALGLLKISVSELDTLIKNIITKTQDT